MAFRQTLFLTGATGVVGSRLLYEILHSTQDRVYCLVRAQDENSARQRIWRVVQIYAGEDLYQAFCERVVPVPGDITQLSLGISPQFYQQIADNSDLVLHIAANVSLVSDYRQLQKTNVDGVVHIGEFCLRHDIPLVYTSTYAVFGDRLFSKGTFFERDLDVGQSFASMGYHQTKFEAEMWIHQAIKRGLQAMILRLGDIFGDSHNGCYPLFSTNITGIFYDIIKTIIETGFAPFLEENFDITPVDYVCQAILCLASHPDSYGKTFHLLNPDHKYFYEIVNLLVECGYRIRSLPYEKYFHALQRRQIYWQGKVYTSPFTNVLLTLGESLPDPEIARFDTAFTTSFLQTANIYCPPVDYNLIATYLNFCLKQGYLPPPARQEPLAEYCETSIQTP